MNITPQPEGLELMTFIVINTLKSLGKVLRTVSHLKPIQVAYQLKNRFTTPGTLKDYYQAFTLPEKKLVFSDLPATSQVLKVDGERYHFTFLNLTYSFEGDIDWKEEGFGKLWNYNLQYLDFLRQEDIGEKIKTKHLYHLYACLESGHLPLEPYPVSLRIMNVIRFLSRQSSPDPQIQRGVHAEIHYLSQNLEYHLLGNHLLENGFALLMGGYYFGNNSWIKRAEDLLQAELQEQLLDDGAHFELSPMYHQIILFRVLEALDYLPQESTGRVFIKRHAATMLSWLRTVTFRNGNIPHFNDSSDGITFTSKQLIKMAKELGLKTAPQSPLSGSGYQPGHAHADSLSFVLQLDDKQLVVDMGLSTYQISPRRDYERSTKAHNTVTVNDQDTAEVWSGFRVGRRPVVRLIKADDREIKANLRYQTFEHSRTFRLDDSSLSIIDEVNGDAEAVARLYLHPHVDIHAIKENEIELTDNIRIKVQGSHAIQASDYLYNQGYNLQ